MNNLNPKSRGGGGDTPVQDPADVLKNDSSNPLAYGANLPTNPSVNITKVKLAEALKETVCRYGSGLPYKMAINAVSLIREFARETGIPPTIEQEEKMAKVVEGAINSELARASRYFSDEHTVVDALLYALEDAKKTEIPPTKKQKTMIEEMLPDLIQSQLIEKLGDIAKDSSSTIVINDVLSALKLVRETEYELTAAEKVMIEKMAPDLIENQLVRASEWFTPRNDAIDSVLFVLEIANQTNLELTTGQEGIVEKIVKAAIQDDLANVLKKFNDGYAQLALAFYPSDIREISEKTGICLSDELGKIVEEITEITKVAFQEQLAYASECADRDNYAFAIYSVLSALEDVRKTEVNLTEEQEEAAAENLDSFNRLSEED